MSRYITKPCEIEATQWFKPGDHSAVKVRYHESFAPRPDGNMSFWVNTRQGEVRVDPGDWVITLSDGETYPCKPDVFAAKYELKANL